MLVLLASLQDCLDHTQKPPSLGFQACLLMMANDLLETVVVDVKSRCINLLLK